MAHCSIISWKILGAKVAKMWQIGVKSPLLYLFLVRNLTKITFFGDCGGFFFAVPLHPKTK
jgi:hypothetical protein